DFGVLFTSTCRPDERLTRPAVVPMQFLGVHVAAWRRPEYRCANLKLVFRANVLRTIDAFVAVGAYPCAVAHMPAAAVGVEQHPIIATDIQPAVSDVQPCVGGNEAPARQRA